MPKNPTTSKRQLEGPPSAPPAQVKRKKVVHPKYKHLQVSHIRHQGEDGTYYRDGEEREQINNVGGPSDIKLPGYNHPIIETEIYNPPPKLPEKKAAMNRICQRIAESWTPFVEGSEVDSKEEDTDDEDEVMSSQDHLSDEEKRLQNEEYYERLHWLTSHVGFKPHFESVLKEEILTSATKKSHLRRLEDLKSIKKVLDHPVSD